MLNITFGRDPANDNSVTEIVTVDDDPTFLLNGAWRPTLVI